MNPSVSTNVVVDGNLIDKISLLFSQHGVYTSIFALFLIVLVIFIYKAGTLYLSKENVKREEEKENLKTENYKLREEKAVNEALKHVEKNKTDKIFTIKPNIEISEFRDLSKHSYFANTQYILDIKLNDIAASSENKKNIFKDYIYTKYKTSSAYWQDVLKNINVETINTDELKYLLINTERESIKECDRILKHLHMPSLVISRMKRVTSFSDKMVLSMIENYCDSDFLEGGFDIIYMLLEYKSNVSDILFTHILLNIEKLNGTLEKYTYESKINNL